MSFDPEAYRIAERTEMRRKRRFSAPLDRIIQTLSAIINPDAPTTVAPGALPALAGDVTGPPGSNTVVKVQGIPVSTTDPTTGQAMKYDGAAWAPGADNDTLLTVQEVDGSPTETPTTTLQFPNGTLTEPVAGTVRYTPVADADEKAKVSANDTTPGYLNGKLVAGAGVTLTENNDGGDETLTLAAVGSGQYRVLAYVLDGVGGFDFVVDGLGNPVTALASLE